MSIVYSVALNRDVGFHFLLCMMGFMKYCSSTRLDSSSELCLSLTMKGISTWLLKVYQSGYDVLYRLSLIWDESVSGPIKPIGII